MCFRRAMNRVDRDTRLEKERVTYKIGLAPDDGREFPGVSKRCGGPLESVHAHFFAVPIRRGPLCAFYLVVDWCRPDSSGN